MLIYRDNIVPLRMGRRAGQLYEHEIDHLFNGSLVRSLEQAVERCEHAHTYTQPRPTTIHNKPDATQRRMYLWYTIYDTYMRYDV